MPIVVVIAASCGLAVVFLTQTGNRPAMASSWPANLAPGVAKGFNILLITLDTTRADRLGCYGCAGAQTPALDQLAARGVRFADAVAPSSMTRPSHASMLTGLDPSRHGVRDNNEYRLAPSNTTLPEILGPQGYETAAFLGSFVLDPRFGLDQGFEVYDATVEITTSPALSHFNQRDARAVTDAAIAWLTRRDRNRPFFAWIHYFDPHEPYVPPPPYAEQFRDRPYDGEIAFMDSQLARLLDALERSGAARRTVILAAGDHGESLGEHGEATHGLLVYEATQHVPLILAGPGLIDRAHVVDGAVVSVTDIFPTVLDLLGIPYDGPCDGVSLLASWKHADRIVYMEALHPLLAHGWAPLYALRRHGDKYIHAPRTEYYDLSADPGELHNLSAGIPRSPGRPLAELAEAMNARLANEPSADDLVAKAPRTDPETRVRLESLGYVSAASSGGSLGQLDPKDMMPTWELIRQSRLLIDRGEYQQALAPALEARKRSPRDRAVLQQLGEIHMAMNRVREAEEALRAVNEIMPSASSCVSLAQVVMAQRRYPEAESLIRQAAALEPDYGGVFIARGDLLAWYGRLNEAIAAYEQGKRADPYRTTGMADQRINRMRELIAQGWQPPPAQPGDKPDGR